MSRLALRHRRPGRVGQPTTVLAGLVGSLLALTGLAGCSGDDEPGDAAPAAATSSRADPEGTAEGGGQLPPTVTVGTVTGRLRPAVARRQAVRVARIVDRWFEAAYLGGEFPRRRYVDAFPGFTEGAVRAARRDRRLMSNVAVARWVESVVPGAKEIQVDLLGVQRRPVGATARFRLVFAATSTGADPVVRQVAVSGKLFLTLGPAGNWRVFGYEMRRAAFVPRAGRPGSAESPSGETAR